MKIQIKNKPLRALVSTLTVLAMIAGGIGAVGGILYLIGHQYGFFGIMAAPSKAGLAADILLGFGTLGVIVAGAIALSGIVVGIYSWIEKLYKGTLN